MTLINNIMSKNLSSMYSFHLFSKNNATFLYRRQLYSACQIFWKLKLYGEHVLFRFRFESGKIIFIHTFIFFQSFTLSFPWGCKQWSMYYYCFCLAGRTIGPQQIGSASMAQWFASDLGLNPIQLHMFLVFISPGQDKDGLVQVLDRLWQLRRKMSYLQFWSMHQ